MTNAERASEFLPIAAAAAGGATAFLAALGVSSQIVHNWKSRGVPVERCPDIERVSGGAVRCEQLRPDVKWEVVRGGHVTSPTTTEPEQLA